MELSLIPPSHQVRFNLSTFSLLLLLLLLLYESESLYYLDIMIIHPMAEPLHTVFMCVLLRIGLFLNIVNSLARMFL